MSLKRKLEGEVEIREGASEVFHDIYANNPHHVSHASLHFVQSVCLQECEVGQPGAIILWNCTFGGNKVTMKTIVEAIDEEKKLVKQSMIEGDMLKEYKTITGTCQVIAKDNETSFVRWTLEYEKLNPQIPEPSAILDSLLAAASHIDDHHHGVQK